MIYFIRHGESEANLQHVFAGQKNNSPLTPKGVLQAREEGEKIKQMGLKIDKIISSPLTRAHHTAKIVAETIGFLEEIEIDDRITEYDMGSLTGTPTFEISSRMLVKAENAEDPQKFVSRVKSFLQEWGESDKNILMVCHAGVGRIIETIRLEMDPVLFYDLPAYPNAAVIKLDWVSKVEN